MGRVKIRCEPEIGSTVRLNGDCKHYVYIGKVKDSGRFAEPVQFDADQNFVVLEVGKRGSGKSFGMGSALEAFCTQEDSCSLASHGTQRRGVLLLDPLDVHWTAIYQLRQGVSEHMDEQYKLLTKWPDLKIENVNVSVFMPAGRQQPNDPQQFRPFYLPVTDLTAEDFALLYGANLVRDPAGMLLFEAYDKVTRTGYVVNGTGFRPKITFGLRDLLACLDDDEIQDPNRGFARETIRAVSQRLRTWLTDPLFQSDAGTSVGELVQAGQLSILCLNRLSEDMRSVITGVLVRKIKAERSRSSQIERRRAFDPSQPQQEGFHMPRAILAIDEAQMIIPSSGGGPARQAIDSYILEGRNFGLSVWMATQRPKGAISSKALSQLDTLIVHRLSSTEDLDVIRELVQSALPAKVKLNDQEVGFTDLIRALEIGTAIVSNDSVSRTFVMDVRPRVLAHGGRAF